VSQTHSQNTSSQKNDVNSPCVLLVNFTWMSAVSRWSAYQIA